MFSIGSGPGKSAPHPARAPPGGERNHVDPDVRKCCAVGGRLAVRSVYIAAEPRRVGQALPLRLVIAFTTSSAA